MFSYSLSFVFFFGLLLLCLVSLLLSTLDVIRLLFSSYFTSYFSFLSSPLTSSPQNDITFWKSRKSLEGLSVRSILISFACQLIIFLYLLDSETSWMILLSAGVSVAIEGWKITKVRECELSARLNE
jgi:hypothetical protein